MLSPNPISLWELMKKFRARSFLMMSRTVGSLVAEDKAIGILTKNVPAGAVPTGKFDSRVLSGMRHAAEVMESDCQALGLVGATATCGRLRDELASDSPSRKRVGELGTELNGRMMDELSGVLLLSLDMASASFYSTPNLFGQEVTDAFPSAIVDIEEACKCYALDRPTACVFHLMRVMEVGLRVLGASLEDPSIDPDKNPTWDRILRRGDDELKKNGDKRLPDWRSKDAFFSDAIANLRSVKTAWRNPTMHVKSGIYDDDKALDVLNAVKGFMRHLATELSEPTEVQ